MKRVFDEEMQLPLLHKYIEKYVVFQQQQPPEKRPLEAVV
jgi:hypothetical protein